MDYDHLVDLDRDQQDRDQHSHQEQPASSRERTGRRPRYSRGSTMPSSQQQQQQQQQQQAGGGTSSVRASSSSMSSTRSAFAAIGQAMRGIFRSASDERINSGVQAQAQAQQRSAAEAPSQPQPQLRAEPEAMDVDVARPAASSSSSSSPNLLPNAPHPQTDPQGTDAQGSSSSGAPAMNGHATQDDPLGVGAGDGNVPPAAAAAAAAAAEEGDPGAGADTQQAAQDLAGLLSPFAEAIQHAAAVNDELNRARGSRPTSPAFGTAQRVTPPPASPRPAQEAANAQDRQTSAARAEGPDAAGAAPSGSSAAAEAVRNETGAAAAPSGQGTGAEAQAQSEAQREAPNAGSGPSLVLFRLPFTASDGRQALLAFQPIPIPGIPLHNPGGAAGAADAAASAGAQDGGAAPHAQAQNQAQNQAQAQAQGQGQAPRSHPHPGGHVPSNPIFVPVSVSPFNFPLLYDANYGLGWPVGAVEPPAPGSEEEARLNRAENAGSRPHLATGPPFQIFFQFATAAGGVPSEEEQPSKEKAEKYVAELERADAELRERMARLGLGDIGDYSDSSSLMETHGTQGCGICLEPFATEDKPEWVVGKQQAEDEAVVAVPCAGHHTLHASCLRGWLENVKPSAWTCPFCRAALVLPPSLAGPASSSSTTTTTTTGANADANVPRPSGAAQRSAEREEAEKRRLDEAQSRSLREEIRYREKQRGWRCDAAACLPRYPAADEAADAAPAAAAGSDDPDSELIKLAPCHHEIHLGCLQTAMRVEADLLTPSAIDEAEDEEEDDAEDDDCCDSDEDEDEDEEANGAATGTDLSASAVDIVPDRKRKREVDLEGSPSSSQDAHSFGSRSPHPSSHAQAAGHPHPPSDPHAHAHARRTVGKWVSCPACRSECWAEIPVAPRVKETTDPGHGQGRRRRRRRCQEA
ncbi:hypothetical protein OC844_003356 [Tilletia horrida]|nr:hypothetical protein OC844_003356 [Tilletia horrida]